MRAERKREREKNRGASQFKHSAFALIPTKWMLMLFIYLKNKKTNFLKINNLLLIKLEKKVKLILIKMIHKMKTKWYCFRNHKIKYEKGNKKVNLDRVIKRIKLKFKLESVGINVHNTCINWLNWFKTL